MQYYDHMLVNEIMYDEGVRTRSYQDTKGYWTIGVGHMLGNSPVYSNIEWDIPKIILVLLTDLNSSIFHVKNQINVFDSLSENRQRVLVNMMFNLGPNKFAGFKKMVKAINRNDYHSAYKEMLDSKWAMYDVPNRARRLAQRWLEG